jgi:hypothetical protein
MRLRHLVVGSVMVALAAAPAAAQWLNHPTPGIPRTKDGKPNLAAPAPRTSDRKPDLSGVWAINGLSAATNITDVDMLPWAQAVYKERLATYGHDDPASNCLPEGPRSGLAGLDPLRIIQTSHLIVILYESGPPRQIFLDGRAHPKDPNPTWMGYSVGRWEGDTLVVETTGFNDRTWLDFSGHPHSDELRVTERFRRTNFGAMQATITYTDPKAYTKPFTITLPMAYQADTDLIESVCNENEKDRPKLVGRVSDETANAKTVPRSVLAGYVGSYDVGPLGAWKVSLDGDVLTVQMADGSPRLPLVPQSDTRFMLHAVGGSLRFVPDARGVAPQMILTIVEGDIPAMRKP